MKHTFMTMILLSLSLTAGCGSMLAKMGAEAIKENPTKRSMGQSIEDTSIANKAIVNIHASNEGFKDARIDVHAYNGFVLITGQVGTVELKDTASQVVSKIPKVRRIYNELELASPTSLLTRTSDRLLSAEIKARLLAREDIQSNRVQVVVENGVVFLMGIAYRVEGERVIAAVSDVGGVQRVVSLFEWLD